MWICFWSLCSFLLLCLFIIVPEILAGAIKQEKEIKGIQIEMPWQARIHYRCANREAALFRGIFSARKDEKVSKKTKPCAGCRKGDRHLILGVDVATCSPGQLPQPGKSQEWGPAQDGEGLGILCSWSQMDAMDEVGPFSAKAKRCQVRRPRFWETGDAQVGDRVLQTGLD